MWTKESAGSALSECGALSARLRGSAHAIGCDAERHWSASSAAARLQSVGAICSARLSSIRFAQICCGLFAGDPRARAVA